MKCTVKTPNRANIDNSETTIWSIFAVNSWEQNKINTRKRKAKSWVKKKSIVQSGWYGNKLYFIKNVHSLLKKFSPFSDFTFESEVLGFSHSGYANGFFLDW